MGSVVVVVVREVGEGLLKFGAAGVDFGPKEFVSEVVNEAVNPAGLDEAGIDPF